MVPIKPLGIKWDADSPHCELRDEYLYVEPELPLGAAGSFGEHLKKLACTVDKKRLVDPIVWMRADKHRK